MTDYDSLLTSEGILHSTETPQQMAHGWDSGWVQIALSALSQDGAALAATPQALLQLSPSLQLAPG